MTVAEAAVPALPICRIKNPKGFSENSIETKKEKKLDNDNQLFLRSMLK